MIKLNCLCSCYLAVLHLENKIQTSKEVQLGLYFGEVFLIACLLHNSVSWVKLEGGRPLSFHKSLILELARWQSPPKIGTPKRCVGAVLILGTLMCTASQENMGYIQEYYTRARESWGSHMVYRIKRVDLFSNGSIICSSVLPSSLPSLTLWHAGAGLVAFKTAIIDPMQLYCRELCVR